MRNLAVFVGLVVGTLAGCRGESIDVGVDVDASTLLVDAAGGSDSSVTDAAQPTPGSRIAAAKASTDGPVDIALFDVLVTYVKPAVGADPGGFFVQADIDGPGLFIAIEPGALIPSPEVGDLVAVNVDTMATHTAGGIRMVTAISGLEVISKANSTDELAVDITSATDVVTALDNYDSRLIEISATIVGDVGSAGAGHQRGLIATTGLEGDANFAFRAPDSVVAALSLQSGCQFTLRGIMWRYSNAAQPSGWRMSDFSNVTCAPPRVVRAVAAGSTTFVVDFDRGIAGVNSNGSEFTLTPALSVTAASVSGTRATLITAAQIPGLEYTVEVGNTVLDQAGQGVDSNFNTATFTGYETRAILVLNEVSASIDLGCDLVELRVVSGGTTAGAELWQRTDGMYTLPAIDVTVNDYIVVHLGKLSNCNSTGATDETTTVYSSGEVNHPQNYDIAFDLYTDTGGLIATTNVITLVDPLGTITDAIMARDAASDPATSTELRAAQVVTADQWVTEAGTAPAGGFVDGEFNSHAVPGLDAPTGQSFQRTGNTDNNHKGDFTPASATSTFGENNVGQSNL